MKVAMIVNGQVANIYDDVAPSDFPDLMLIDITDRSAGILLGDDYDIATDTFGHPLPTPVDPEVVKEARNAPIRSALLALDLKAIRPLRDGETERVAELADQAAVLRAQLIA